MEHLTLILSQPEIPQCNDKSGLHTLLNLIDQVIKGTNVQY